MGKDDGTEVPFPINVTGSEAFSKRVQAQEPRLMDKSGNQDGTEVPFPTTKKSPVS